jgi:adenylate cyclase
VKLTEGEQASGVDNYSRGKQGLDCYLKIMEGSNYLSGGNIKDTQVARRIAEEAMAMCPENPVAYLLMGQLHSMEYWLRLGKSLQESIEKGMDLIQKALAMDNSLCDAHCLLSNFYSLKRDHEKAIAAGERAVALEPGGAHAHFAYGMSLNYGGRSEEAIPVLQKAIRLNPLGETGSFVQLGHAYRVTGRFEEAVSAYKKVLQRSPDNIFAHYSLAATYIWLGHEKEARVEAEEVLRINPKFQLDYLTKGSVWKDQSVVDNLVDALRKAGLK